MVFKEYEFSSLRIFLKVPMLLFHLHCLMELPSCTEFVLSLWCNRTDISLLGSVYSLFLRYIRDLLLNPPAYEIASTIQGEFGVI